MVKGVYSRMIWNLQLSVGSQYLQYIHDFIMDTVFRLMDNLMPQMMEKQTQMPKRSKGDPDTPTLNKATTGP